MRIQFVKYNTNREDALYKFKTAILLIVAFFVLTACTSKPAETAVATDDPTAEATVEAVASVAPVSNECLNCHTDKQHLIDTATPIVAVEAESKGVG
jgi:uncharacterized lipoprotein YajG